MIEQPGRMWILMCSVVLLTVAEGHGQAGGLSLPETGGPIDGTAQAGSAAVARDAQTSRLNPAGMTRLERVELLGSFQPFLLDFEFNPSPGVPNGGGDQGGWLPNGAVYLAAPLNKSVAVGFSVTAPAGLQLDPDDDWVGRYFMTEVTLFALNLQPSIGVRLSEQWSIGAGVDIQYARFEQDIAVNRPLLLPDGKATIDGDSWEVGFSLSVLWEPLETTRIGLRYHSEISHDLSGDLTAFAATPVSTGLAIPQSLTLSGYHEFNEQFALLADLGWQDWSAFDRTIISIDGLTGGQVEIPRDFKDTWTLSLGAHVRPAENWLIMFGGGYTSAAVDDDKRTPDLPVDEQVRVSVGLEYEINDKWRVGGNYTFLWLGDNEVNVQLNPSTGRVVGDYDAYLHLFGVYASLRF